MKKALTLVLALVLCLSVLSVAAFAADYNSISVIGSLGDWAVDYEMTETSNDVYTLTKHLDAGSYEFKIRANNDWAVNWGGAYMASGQAFDVYMNGANIAFTVEEACDVTFELDLTNFNGSTGAKCTITIGGKVETPVEVAKIKVHVSVPEDWGDVYVYVWNPEHLGSWSGTKMEGEYIEIPASFDGMVINNGNGRQAADIKDIDLTKKEVWIVINEYNGYTLYYEAPSGEEEQPEVGTIKVHVSVPEGWGDIYVYVWNPEQLGSWSGTKLEGEYIEVPAAFEGMVINNGNGTQSWDIKDIDLTKEEVWITVNADGSYTLAYQAPAGGEGNEGGEAVTPNNPPLTGDDIVVVAVAMVMAAACGTLLLSKKKYF